MITLHVIDGGGASGLEHATVSFGLLAPRPEGGQLLAYDFGSGEVVELDPNAVVAVLGADPPRVSFAPDLGAAAAEQMAANRRRPLRRRAELEEVPTGHVTGYDTYAAAAVRAWRGRYVGMQPLLAAGVFALSTVQTPIVSALRLFSLLGPHVVEDELPPLGELQRIVRRSGAGLDSLERGRPRWYAEYEVYRGAIFFAHRNLQDDELRHRLSVRTPMPLGLGLAKLSFTLAIVGQNLGCLDARILDWAFTKRMRNRFNRRIGKSPDGTVLQAAYNTYRDVELELLTERSPFYDPDDPVGIARSQWMLWEALGPPQDRRHTHEELFEAVVDKRLFDERIDP